MDRISVTKDYYSFKDYCTKQRWVSYWHQLSEVFRIIDSQDQEVILIGDGDGLTKQICNHFGIRVKTVDIELDLSPDYLISVTELSKVIKEKYPVVLCCQVLEHIPFDQFELAIKELSLICSNTCIISLPQNHIPIYLRIGIGYNINKVFCLYRFWNKHQFDGVHYWELGGKYYSKRKIKRILSKHFNITNDYTVKENTYHHFFICRKNEQTV